VRLDRIATIDDEDDDENTRQSINQWEIVEDISVVAVVVNSGWRCKQQDNAPSVYLLFWVQQKVFRYNRL